MPGLARAAWRPEFFSSLTLDLNADLLTGNDGDALAAWNNSALTGSGNNYAQSVAGNKPLLKRNIINGHSVVRFDGVNDFMSTSFAPAAAQSTSVFLVFKAASSTGTKGVYIIKDASATGTTLYLLSAGGYQPYNFESKTGAAASASGIADARDTNAHLIQINYNNGTKTLPASYTAALDGTAKTVVASPGVLAVGATDLSTIGAAVTLGLVTSSPFDGDIARLLFFEGAITSPQAAATTQYLRNIYGI